jgi:hypothetical protein
VALIFLLTGPPILRQNNQVRDWFSIRSMKKSRIARHVSGYLAECGTGLVIGPAILTRSVSEGAPPQRNVPRSRFGLQCCGVPKGAAKPVL